MDEKLNLLNELSSGEDEFDVDLMACGCRLAVSGMPGQVTLPQYINRGGFTSIQLQSILGRVTSETGVVRGYAHTSDKEELTRILDEVTLETNFDMTRFHQIAEEVKRSQ